MLILLAADSVVARITSLDTIEKNIKTTNNSITALKTELKMIVDFGEKGIWRACTRDEAASEGREALMKTKTLKVIGIGASWLAMEKNRSRLIEMLNNNCPVHILLPDPCSGEVIDRYTNDEPPEFELGLPGIANRIKDWHGLSQRYKSLSLKVYKMYPVATVTVYDEKIFVSPVLYKRRAMDNLTIIFHRPSSGATIYEDHFNQVFLHGAAVVDENYLQKLALKFPNLV